MSFVIGRFFKPQKGFLFSSSAVKLPNNVTSRCFSDDRIRNDLEYCSSTIMVENGCNVQELPVIVRRLKNLNDCNDKKPSEIDTNHSSDPNSFHLIQAEFKECLVLRDVFSLLSKCTKITPNIALGAMERIYDLEKNPSFLDISPNNINVAKDAIVDKLLKVVMKTEETQTILNALNSVSSFIEPYKPKFSEEILLRVIDNKLSIDQLCDFTNFLINNKDPEYDKIIDKLWVGFFERSSEINEVNLLNIFKLLPYFQDSKRIVFSLLEQKLSELWMKTKQMEMIEILDIFVQEKYWFPQSFSYAGRWLNTNIHSIDEDSLLDIISKFTKLNYNDDQIERALERYMKARGDKIKSPILIIGMMNYCLHFRIRNATVLNTCCNYFIENAQTVPHSFVKSIVYPFGYLNFDPSKSSDFWAAIENYINYKFDSMTVDDMTSIVLSFIYAGKHPKDLVSRIFTVEHISRMDKTKQLSRKMHLIDTAMSLECQDYIGPLLPKDSCPKVILQDGRIKNLINRMWDNLVVVAGDASKLSTCVSIPHLYSDSTNLIDIMIHPVGLGSNTFNWKVKSARDENIAILIHLPEHYCSDNKHLIGPQEMRRRLLKLLGLRVISLSYDILNKYHISDDCENFKKYLTDKIRETELLQ